jgi:hypothetical protein
MSSQSLTKHKQNTDKHYELFVQKMEKEEKIIKAICELKKTKGFISTFATKLYDIYSTYEMQKKNGK